MENNGTRDEMFKINGINELEFYHSIWQFRELMLISTKPQKTSNGLVKSLWLPKMCLIAFVCELEIKYICYFSNQAVYRCHNLEVLFKKMPDDIKKRIKSRFKKNNGEFNKLLYDYSLVFETWRYKFEFNTIKNIDCSFLCKLEMLLYEIISEYRALNGLR